MNRTKYIAFITVLLILTIILGALFFISNNRLLGDFIYIKDGEIILRLNGIEKNIGSAGDISQGNIELSNDKKFVMSKDNNKIIIWSVENSSQKSFELDKKINAVAWGKNSNEIIYSNQEGLWQLLLNDSSNHLIYKNVDNDFIDLNTKITPNHDATAFALDFRTGESWVGGIIVGSSGNVNTTTKRCGITQDWSSDNKTILIAQKYAIGGCNGLYIVNVEDGKDVIVNNDIFYPESAKFYNNGKSIYVIENNNIISLEINTNQIQTIGNLADFSSETSSKIIIYSDSNNSLFIFLQSTEKGKSEIIKITGSNTSLILENID